MSTMRGLVLALPLLLLAPLAPASPLAADPGGENLELLSHNDLVFQHDADGGVSVRGLIDDHPDGSYTYTRVADVSTANQTLGRLLRALNRTLGDTVAQTPMPFDESGVYEHRWTRQWSASTGSPMVTVGVYGKSREQGLVRLPLALLENVTAIADAVAIARATLTNDLPDTVNNLVPFLLEAADPTQGTHFSTYPVPGSEDSYADRPTVYAWLVRKSVPGREVWLGLYAERSGSFEGNASAGHNARATKLLDLGVAARVDHAAALHLAGVFLRHDIERRGTGTEQETRSFFTVGASSLQGRVALAAMEGFDLRRDAAGELNATPDHQETGFSLGAVVAGSYTPLLGARTTAAMKPSACPEQPEGQPSPQSQCLRVEQLTSLGVYVQGRYTPLAGLHSRGDRNPPLPWAQGFVDGGGPGAQSMGDFDLDVGTFLDGAYLPLLGVQYRDRFQGGQRAFQGMLSAGPFGPRGYQPLLGLTYDGERPLLTWVQAYLAGNRGARGDWLASAGTFVGPQYAPLVGVRYQNSVAGASYQDQQQFTVGAFAGRYEAFVPLLLARYDGDRTPQRWAASFATTGTLGSDAGNFNLHAGTWLNGSEVPVVGMRYRTDYGSGWPKQSFLTIGIHGPGGFVPVVGASYSGQDDLVGSLNSPTSTTDDGPSYATVGVFVQGQYVPLVGAANSGDETLVSVLPPWY